MTPTRAGLVHPDGTIATATSSVRPDGSTVWYQWDPDKLGFVYWKTDASATRPPSSAQPWAEADFVSHYFSGGGNVTLATVGLEAEIRNARVTREAFGRFRGQIIDQAVVRASSLGIGQHAFTHGFDNTYDFGGVRWVIGGAALEGKFAGLLTVNPDGTFRLSGTWDFFFHDDFEDFFDVGNDFPGNQEAPGGTPFSIDGSWTERFPDAGGLWGSDIGQRIDYSPIIHVRENPNYKKKK